MPLQPINIWIAKKYTDAVWNADDLYADPFFSSTAAMIQAVAADQGLTAADGNFLGYRYTGDAMDQKLSLQGYSLPQLIFSTPDPKDATGAGQVFLAKLVQGQITRKNFETMWTAVRRLKYQVDPTSQKAGFYDPTFAPFRDIAIGIPNTASAPGAGALIGLNPLSNSLTINRGGQILGSIADLLKKIVPVVIGATVIYLITEDKKKKTKKRP